MGNKILIVNGGSPLKGCPTDWKDAGEWADNANIESEGGFERPCWSWDCGFKLDYDGAILRVSSRFYPPKSHYGNTWNGTVTVCIFDKEVKEKKFDCETLEMLKSEVESYISELKLKIESVFE